MASRQIIQVLRLSFETRVLSWAVECAQGTAVDLFLVLSLESRFLLVVTRFGELPELNA